MDFLIIPKQKKLNDLRDAELDEHQRETLQRLDHLPKYTSKISSLKNQKTL